MRNTQNVCLTLPTDKVRELDQVAEAEKRTRSNLILLAVDEWLALRNAAGRARQAELEALAQAGMTKASPAPNTAAEAHLREHARLSGLRYEEPKR